MCIASCSSLCIIPNFEVLFLAVRSSLIRNFAPCHVAQLLGTYLPDFRAIAKKQYP